MCDLFFSLYVPCHYLRFTLLYSISSSLPVFLIAGVAIGISIVFIATRLASPLGSSLFSSSSVHHCSHLKLLIFGLLISNFLVAFCSQCLLGSWLGADLLCSAMVHHSYKMQSTRQTWDDAVNIAIWWRGHQWDLLVICDFGL
ncbi:uncharacterized protein DS421_14g466850 [Arachis hypogaea]|nr:uncharacterized protein DS421_14g466850 [Arachis hypogaea]